MQHAIAWAIWAVAGIWFAAELAWNLGAGEWLRRRRREHNITISAYTVRARRQP